jgi:hypothetical protein
MIECYGPSQAFGMPVPHSFALLTGWAAMAPRVVEHSPANNTQVLHSFALL